MNLLRGNDPKAVWKAISWNGALDPHSRENPDDQAFKERYESLLLNPEAGVISTLDISASPNKPVLDDPISVREVQEAVSNQTKAADQMK